MATRASIEFDFTQAKRQAQKLEEIADRLSNLSKNNLNGTLQGVAQNWKGTNASDYLSKGQKLQKKVNTSADQLRAIAREIRATARRVYNAEMAALAIAESRGR